MGVRGLTTLVQSHRKQLLQDLELHDTKLVIDGSGLLWYLFSEVCKADPMSHGGEYELFRSKVHFFFQNLLKCNCSPFVVFDGSFDLDDKKQDTTIERFQDHIKQAKDIITGGNGLILPPLMKDLMMQVMLEMGVCYAVSQFEADREIAMLANSWQCPVLGKDSDFFIMDIIAGYIPLTLLKWKEVNKSRERSCCMSGCIYHIESFCKFFHLKKELLPLFATLCGNDYVRSSSVNAFLSHVYGRFDTGCSKRQTQLMHLIHWMTEQTSCDGALDKVWQHVPQKGVLENSIKASIQTYAVTEDACSLKSYFEGDKTYDFETRSQLCVVIGVPVWVAAAHQKGQIHNECINILSKRCFFSFVQVEHPKQSSAWTAAKSLCSIIAGIVLAGKLQKSDLKEKDKHCTVYIRNGDGFQRFRMIPVITIDAFGNLPSLSDIPALTERDRMKLFLAALVPTSDSIGVDIESIPTDFQFASLVTIHWINAEHTQMSKIHVITLLLGWVYHYTTRQQRKLKTSSTLTGHSRQYGSGGSIDSVKIEVEAVCSNFTQYQRRLKKKKPDAVTSHCFAQWQNCMCYAMHLSGLLQDPFKSNQDIAILYNGLTVHSVYAVLKDLPPRENLQRWIASKLFQGAPKAYQLYESMQEFILSHIKSDIQLHNNGKKCTKGQGPCQQKAKPKAQGQHQQQTKIGAKTPDNTDESESDDDSAWAANNKFASLRLDDF